MEQNLYSGISPLKSYLLNDVVQLKPKEIDLLSEQHGRKVSGAIIINYLHRTYGDAIPKEKSHLTIDQVTEKLNLTFHQVYEHLITHNNLTVLPISRLHEVKKDLEEKVEILDSATLYFQQIKNHDLLTIQEEGELSIAIKKGDKKAFAKLVESNLKLVLGVAKKYERKTKLPLKELIQEGNVGLINSIPKFDHTLGYKFSTYATWWIRQSIHRYISNNDLIRIPVHIHEARNKINKFIGAYQTEHGFKPSSKEIGKELGFPAERITFLMDLKAASSLDAIFEGESNEMIEDEVVDVEEIVERNTLKGKVKEAFSILSEREAYILNLRFGVDDGWARSLEEVGKKIGVTRERVRQIEARAIKKLKNNPEVLKLLSDFY